MKEVDSLTQFEGVFSYDGRIIAVLCLFLIQRGKGQERDQIRT